MTHLQVDPPSYLNFHHSAGHCTTMSSDPRRAKSVISRHGVSRLVAVSGQ